MPIGVEDQAIIFGAYDNGIYNAATNTAYHYFRKNDPTFKITAKTTFYSS
jgi:hypothetical protein